ncbi:3-oxoacyl-[acyl-carrier-protein] reductase FabG-like [Watersipora subatra]|uniref:3-oxoacyl-[acyl-carrier-protein] reductase FabG-like n=1 Tax=Watersipora subatra TaxID=2589382 RepID=UPI00355AD571
MATSMKDKVVLITGASSGIGKATAIHFASLGSKLVINGRDESALEETASECKGAVGVLQVVGDVTKEAVVQGLVQKTIEHYGQLDVLVNNAGMAKSGSIETTSLEQYDMVMNVNVRSVYHLTMLAVPHLIATKGAIVNVSSVTGIRAFPGVLAYCVSKSAIDQFTRCIALELASKQVRVNSVNPGVIVTNFHKRLGQSEEQYFEFLEHCKTTHALGRVGEAEEVAKSIAFLASSDSSFITGVQLPIDGGRHVMCPR